MNFRRQCWVAIAVLAARSAHAQAETPAVVGERVPAPVIEDIHGAAAPLSKVQPPDRASKPPKVRVSSAFAEALQRMAEEHADHAQAEPTTMSDVEPLPDTRARFAAALRNTARVLEVTAADLEDVAAYDEADELRKRAAQLRFDARQALTSAEKCVVE